MSDMWTKPPPVWEEKKRKSSLTFWIIVLLVYLFIVIIIWWTTLNFPFPSDFSLAIFIIVVAMFSVIYAVIISRIVAIRWLLKGSSEQGGVDN